MDSYFSKFRTKMKQLLDPRNFIPTNFRFGSGKSESEKNDSLEVVESEEEQTGMGEGRKEGGKWQMRKEEAQVNGVRVSG